jgi:hypothetical protein
MIERSVERRALPREVIDLPALLSFDGISGVHSCVVRDINAFGACLSTPYYMFASDFDLSFSGFDRTFGCRVVWRRATLSGVAFVLRRRAPTPVNAKVEIADILQLNHLLNRIPPLLSAASAQERYFEPTATKHRPVGTPPYDAPIRSQWFRLSREYNAASESGLAQ